MNNEVNTVSGLSNYMVLNSSEFSLVQNVETGANEEVIAEDVLQTEDTAQSDTAQSGAETELEEGVSGDEFKPKTSRIGRLLRAPKK